jgi:hypothetical protein
MVFLTQLVSILTHLRKGKNDKHLSGKVEKSRETQKFNVEFLYRYF